MGIVKRGFSLLALLGLAGCQVDTMPVTINGQSATLQVAFLCGADDSTCERSPASMSSGYWSAGGNDVAIAPASLAGLAQDMLDWSAYNTDVANDDADGESAPGVAALFMVDGVLSAAPPGATSTSTTTTTTASQSSISPYWGDNSPAQIMTTPPTVDTTGSTLPPSN